MKTVSLSKAKASLSEIVTNAEYKQERVIVEKRNKPVAMIIGYNDYKRLEKLEDIFESKILKESLKTDKFYSVEEVAEKVKLEL